MNAFGVLPLPFVVTDIQPAPNNFAGATVETNGGFHQGTHARPIVLVDQGGHWLITHDTAMTELDVFWRVANRTGGMSSEAITDELRQAPRRGNAGGDINRFARNGSRRLRRFRTRPLHRSCSHC
jgi:hypothetical protein